MTSARLSGLISRIAGPTLLLRVGVVGCNFLVMMGLAWGLGLAQFGELMVLWGMAMVASTAMSLGAPLLILRVMADGTGMRTAALLRQVVLFPLLLALIGAVTLPAVFSGIAWGSVILMGLALNALSCLASMMRALGSVQLSMVLRDGVPQLALGAAVFVAVDPQGILLVTAGFTSGAALLVLRHCLTHRAVGTCIHAGGDAGALRFGLWANAVLGMATAQIDIILGGALLPADQIGLYALLRRIANLVALPVSVATWVSAGPIAAAFGAQDAGALRAASKAGSRVALWPGVALFGGALLLLPLWSALEGVALLALVLLGGAFVQVCLASGLTVATLCGLERFALLSRLASIALYLACVLAAGTMLTPMGNALAYLAGVVGGGALLWWALWRQLQIDTSALSLWRGAPCKQP